MRDNCTSGLCIKRTLMGMNLLFLFMGIALVSIGAYIITRFSHISTLVNTTLPIFLIVIGSLVTLVSFFGCCGAWRESQRLLLIYLVCLLVLLVSQLIIGGLAYKFTTKLEDNLHRAWLKDTSNEDRNFLQDKFDCCGFLDAKDAPGSNCHRPSNSSSPHTNDTATTSSSSSSSTTTTTDDTATAAAATTGDADTSKEATSGGLTSSATSEGDTTTGGTAGMWMDVAPLLSDVGHLEASSLEGSAKNETNSNGSHTSNGTTHKPGCGTRLIAYVHKNLVMLEVIGLVFGSLQFMGLVLALFLYWCVCCCGQSRRDDDAMDFEKGRTSSLSTRTRSEPPTGKSVVPRISMWRAKREDPQALKPLTGASEDEDDW